MNGLSVDARLTALVESCEQTAQAMTQDAASADRMALQLLLTQRATAWHRWAAELRALHSSIGAAQPTPRSRAAAVMLSDDSDHALLASCQRREASALKLYRDALEENVAPIARAVLWRHVDGIHDSLARMRELKLDPLPAHH
jgi:hypothetical protein